MLKIIPDNINVSDIIGILGYDGYFNMDNSSYIIADHVGNLYTNGPFIIIDADVYYEITSYGGLLYYCEESNNNMMVIPHTVEEDHHIYLVIKYAILR